MLLPVATFAETSGTHVNCTGLAQSFAGAAPGRGQARPAWKVLRVLGNLMGLEGFDYVSSDEIRSELSWQGLQTQRPREWRIRRKSAAKNGDGIDLERICDLPIYRVDSLVRHAPALQATADNPQPAAAFNPQQARSLELGEGDSVSVHQAESKIVLPVRVDSRIPEGCVYFPAGFPETATIASSGHVRVLRH